MTVVSRLEWDSSFFGFPIGRADISDAASLDFADAFRGSAFRLVYAFAPDGALSSECRSRLAAAGGVLMDVRTVYRKALPPSAAMPSGVVKAVAVTPDMERLAEESGVCSRFMKDPLLRPRAAAMYRRWIARDFARGVVLIRPGDDGIDGLVTISACGGEGHVGLLAVDRSSRGRGVGRLLVAAAEAWCLSCGAAECKIVTQDANAPARSLYERCGFAIDSRTEVWHVRNDGGTAK